MSDHGNAHSNLSHINSTEESVALVSSAVDSLQHVLDTLETVDTLDTVAIETGDSVETAAIETLNKIVTDLVSESVSGGLISESVSGGLVSESVSGDLVSESVSGGDNVPVVTVSKSEGGDNTIKVALTAEVTEGRSPPRLSPVMTRGAAHKVRRTLSFPEETASCQGDVTSRNGDVTFHNGSGDKENGIENGTDLKGTSENSDSVRLRIHSADPLSTKSHHNSKYDLSILGSTKLTNPVSCMVATRSDASTPNGLANTSPMSRANGSANIPDDPSERRANSPTTKSRSLPTPPPPGSSPIFNSNKPTKSILRIRSKSTDKSKKSDNRSKKAPQIQNKTSAITLDKPPEKLSNNTSKEPSSETTKIKKPVETTAKPAETTTKPAETTTKPSETTQTPPKHDSTKSVTLAVTEEPSTSKAGALLRRGSTASVKKWKRTGLAVKTSLKFQDAGRMARLRRVYNKLKSDSMNYINALAKDNVFEDEDPFILQHFNERAKTRKPVDANKAPGSEEHTTFIIDPAGDLFFFTQGLVTIAMLYNLISSVLRMSFAEFEQQSKFVIFTLDTICDVIYLLDFVVHFRTGYLDDGILVTDIGKIKEHYMATPTFSYDLISVVPLSLSYGVAMEIYQHSIYFFTSRPDVEASMIKNILIGEAVLRLAKLAKFYSMRRFFESFGSRTNSPGVMRAFCLIAYLLLSIHWVGCIYYCISEYEGFGINNWVFPKYEDDDYNNQFYRKYIRCFYWAFLTLTTIGGPEHPDTTIEYIVTCITFLLGIFIFAAVVGNVGDAITSMNESKTTYQKRADAIKLYMQHHGVPDILQKKVKKWLEYSWMRTQGADEQSLMDALPERLRARIAIQIHVKTLKKVKIFENCEHGLLCELVLKLRPQIFSPGDFICRIGEIGKEMFIISHGKVECIITTNTGERKTVAVLVAGQSFGEIALLGVEGCSRRTADVRAIGYSELLSLSKKALTQALEDYPEARKQLEAEGRNRLGKGSSKQTIGAQKSDDSDGEGTGSLEVTNLIKDLKSFDSIKHRGKLAALAADRVSLQQLLDDKTRELEDANRKIEEITRTMSP